MAHKWVDWLQNHSVCGFSNTLDQRTKSRAAHKWAGWLHNPCRPGRPQCFRAEDKINSGLQVGGLAT